MCKVWNIFKIKKIENYLYAYNIQDIILLLDVDIDLHECKT